MSACAHGLVAIDMSDTSGTRSMHHATSLAKSICPVTGDKQRETTRRAALRDHLRISHPLSRKEKRRLAKEVQERDLLKKQKGH